MLNPDPTLLGTIIAHPLASTCDVATICEIRNVYIYQMIFCHGYMQAVPKFKNSAPGPDHARLRVFCNV